MAIQKQGVIEAVSTKQVKTRFGDKDTYSIKVGGDWYNAGFAKLHAGQGDTVTFEYDETKWGKQIVKGTLAMGVGGNPASGSVTPNPRTGTNTSGKGVFPVPTFDGQRSIIRQNAVTNANQMIRTAIENVDGFLPNTIDEMLKVLIDTARAIESYTTGDSDREEAKRIASTMAAQKAWEAQHQAGMAEAAEDEEGLYNS